MSKIPNDESELQFVLLRHELESAASGRSSHWDLMMQFGQRLETWALDHHPLDLDTMIALRLADHRIDYLDYQGAVSKNRGSVKRLDRGTLNWVSRELNLRIADLAGELVLGRIRLEPLPIFESSQPPGISDSTGSRPDSEFATNDYWQLTFLSRS